MVATAMIDSISRETGAFEWDSTSDSGDLTPEYLAGYDVLFMNNNASLGLLLDTINRHAIRHFVNSGGAVMGCHSTLNLRKPPWPWFTDTLFGCRETYLRCLQTTF
jgi:type 1 glutamine amidotransferase